MCLIAALWEHMNPPFRALVKILTTTILHQFIVHVLLFQDEWDVFLDAMNRNEISRTLLKFGLKNPDNQFLFISPQGAEEVNCDEENRDRVSVFEVNK